MALPVDADMFPPFIADCRLNERQQGTLIVCRFFAPQGEKTTQGN
jgi:hypothetical protein